jgi:hypothetical protein
LPMRLSGTSPAQTADVLLGSHKEPAGRNQGRNGIKPNCLI